MSIFSSYKKIFLLGFIIVILLAIPFSVYIARQRQQATSKAAASTVLSFEPASSTIKVDDILTLNVILDPGSGALANQVSFVKLSINYDPAKFVRISESDTTLTPNTDLTNALTSILEDPAYTSGSISISLSIGADPTKVITTKTKIAILKLKALSVTAPSNPSSITFGADTQVLSIATTDQTSENVLSTTTPATITINPAVSGVGSPTPTPTISSGSTSTPTPTPTSAPLSSGGTTASVTADLTPIAQLLPTSTPTPFPQVMLPPTGPGENILGIGIIGAIFTVIGAALLILL